MSKDTQDPRKYSLTSASKMKRVTLSLVSSEMLIRTEKLTNWIFNYSTFELKYDKTQTVSKSLRL